MTNMHGSFAKDSMGLVVIYWCAHYARLFVGGDRNQAKQYDTDKTTIWAFCRAPGATTQPDPTPTLWHFDFGHSVNKDLIHHNGNIFRTSSGDVYHFHFLRTWSPFWLPFWEYFTTWSLSRYRSVRGHRFKQCINARAVFVDFSSALNSATSRVI